MFHVFCFNPEKIFQKSRRSCFCDCCVFEVCVRVCSDFLSESSVSPICCSKISSCISETFHGSSTASAATSVDSGENYRCKKRPVCRVFCPVLGLSITAYIYRLVHKFKVKKLHVCHVFCAVFDLSVTGFIYRVWHKL